jgi:hypothetical protein
MYIEKTHVLKRKKEKEKDVKKFHEDIFLEVK